MVGRVRHILPEIDRGQIFPFGHTDGLCGPASEGSVPVSDTAGGHGDHPCIPVTHTAVVIQIGHIHNRISDEYRQLFLQFNALNAGVDVNGYAPVTFDELVANNLEFKLKALSSEEDREVLKTRFALFEKKTN